MANDRKACTFKSLTAGVLAVLLIASLLQFSQIIGNTNIYLSQDAIPGSAVLVMLGFALVSGLFLKLFGIRWLSREELFLVFVVALLAIPIMGRGFLMNLFPMTTALVRENRFDYSSPRSPQSLAAWRKFSPTRSG